MVAAGLARIEQTRSQMSQWVDGDDPAKQKAAILVEDAATAICAAGWVVERADPARVAMLTHRRMSADGHQNG